jgi:hypothetical protein
MPPEPPPESDARRFSEQIDGRTATLSRNQFNGTYYIGAQWDAPSVWLTAETPDSDAPDLLLNIARTVRFVSK